MDSTTHANRPPQGDASWPATTYEPRPWVRSGDEIGSRRRIRAAAGPYDAAVPPLIADLTVALPTDLVTAAEDAGRELTRFDAEVGPLAAPFSAILLRTESASSSEVENLTSSAKQVALAEIGASSSPNARLIVGNVAAMEAAIALADDLDPGAILTMHRALLEKSDPGMVGQWRDEQVWIGGGSVSPHRAAFIPPHHDRVPELMDDVMRFARRDDVPVIVQIAIAHAQFETIHPFPDGNGRTGRALLHALLRRYELTRAVTVPVSAGLLTDVDSYFTALTAYRSGDPSPIVASLAMGSLEAVVNARQLVDDLHHIRARWDDVITARRDAAAWRVADLLLRQPVLDAATLAREIGIAPGNALRALEPLVTAGVVTEFSGRSRNRLWQAREVLEAVDAFAARAGRRRAG